MTRGRLICCVGVLAVLGTVCSAVYVGTNPETQPLDAEVRARLGGRYVSLSDGVTHYALSGDSGPVVVMLHGSTVSIWDFDLQVAPLVSAGFRVLRYDALGRGYSDRPRVPYTRELYHRQLMELLDAVVGGEPVVLMGHSLGGATATRFAAKHPARVGGVALVGPVIDSVTVTAPFVICRLPVLGPLIHRLAMSGVLERRATDQWRVPGVDPAPYRLRYREQASFEGFEYSVCSMFRTGLVGDYRLDYRQLNAADIPVLVIYGSTDRIIGMDRVQGLKEMASSFRFVEIPDGGHSPHVSHVEEVNRRLLSFLSDIFSSRGSVDAGR